MKRSCADEQGQEEIPLLPSDIVINIATSTVTIRKLLCFLLLWLWSSTLTTEKNTKIQNTTELKTQQMESANEECPCWESKMMLPQVFCLGHSNDDDTQFVQPVDKGVSKGTAAGQTNNLTNALRATAESHWVTLTSRCLEAQLGLHPTTESAIFILRLLCMSLFVLLCISSF